MPPLRRAEEFQLTSDLSHFDLVGERATTLRALPGSGGGGLKHELNLPGLAEKRPSVMVGDEVRVSLVGEPQRVWRARAEGVYQEQITLAFSSDFGGAYVAGGRVEVRFILDRLPLQLFHEGIAKANQLQASLLFPEPVDVEERNLRPARIVTSVLSPFDPKVGAPASHVP